MSSKFSVLCSLYFKEHPSYLEQCFESLAWQKLPADEIIIVHDGPLTEELYTVLSHWKTKLPIKEIILEKNVGLGEALNIGLQYCNFELVARVDTDDVNHPDRFQQQINFLEKNHNISAISAHITEFEVDYKEPLRMKKVPTGIENIKKYILQRNPMNHMATVFRKSDVIDSGGYKHLLFMEDYYLWLRMIAKGYSLDNIHDILVSARVGDGMIKRRRGIAYAKSELMLMKEIYKLKLTKNLDVFIYFTIRTLLRLIPTYHLKSVYRIFLR